MCTVSWRHDGDGFELFCNRDEKRDRPCARAPEIQLSNGVRYVAPVDGGRGGAWISVNEFGVALCLLNGTAISAPEGPPVEPGVRSRGFVVAALAGVRGVDLLPDALTELDIGEYAPFTLLALEPGLPASVAEWDGRRTAYFPNANLFGPLVSSSYDPGRVRASRHGEYARITRGGIHPTTRDLMRYHRSHAPAVGAYSPCMHREDAQTVSFSRVKVDRERARFSYLAGAPCSERSVTARTILLAH